MEYLASVGTRGLTVAANATTLNGALNDSVTTVIVSHDDVFVAGQTITVDQEDITLTTDSGDSLTFTGCTRSANGTSNTAHVDGANAMLAGGTELLTFTYNAVTAEYLKGIRASAIGVQAVFAFEYDGTIWYQEPTTANNRAVIIPMHSTQGVVSKVEKIYAWLFRAEAANGVFHAYFQGV